MNPLDEFQRHVSRRTFLGTTACGIGQMALGGTAGRPAAADRARAPLPAAASACLPHFTPKAKRVLCLFQSEGFSHVDLFDNKPTLAKSTARKSRPRSKATSASPA